MKSKRPEIKFKKNTFLATPNFLKIVQYYLHKQFCLHCFFHHGLILILFVIFLPNLTKTALCNVNVVESKNESGIKYPNESSLTQMHELFPDSTGRVWSDLLEDYILSIGPNGRTSKDLPINIFDVSDGVSPGIQILKPSLNRQQMKIDYHSSAYRRPPVFITKRIGKPAVELEPHMHPPMINPNIQPMINQMVNEEQRQQPGLLHQLFGLGGSTTTLQQHHQQHRPVSQNHVIQQESHAAPPFRAVTENDLYLLGAIEKMVYRVDYLESRIRRAEQLIYYLMAGNNQKEVRDPCPTNFSRIGDNCFYINSYQKVNWKSANTACKALGAHLTEFERPSESEEIMAYILNQQQYRGRDYWLGGLNPGLLWIWSNSAKPVNPNMNLTSIAMSHKHDGNLTQSNLIDSKDEQPDVIQNKILTDNVTDIKGQGRCLRLTYNESKHSYFYYGEECVAQHHYICEYEDNTLDNKIKKIARDLKLFD